MMNIGLGLGLGMSSPATAGGPPFINIDTPVVIGTATQASGASSSTAIVITGAVPAGGTVWIVLSVAGSVSPNATPATDTRGNTYITQSNSGGSPRQSVMYANVTTALQIGDTITLATASATGDRVAFVLGLGGLATSSPVELSGTQTTGSTASPATNASGATTSHNVLMIGHVVRQVSTGVTFTPSSFTMLNSGNPLLTAGVNALWIGYRIIDSLLGDTFSGTFSAGSQNWYANLFALRGVSQ